jgi:hypothetical protein
MKYESCWEHKEEKCKQKAKKEHLQAEKEKIQRQEMETLKKSIKHTQEVGEGTTEKLERMSHDIFGLMQLMVQSIQ